MTDDEARAEAYRWRRERLLAWRQMRREIRADTFMQEWLREAEAFTAELLRADLSDPSINQAAEANGFRTARIWLDAGKERALIAHRFLHESAFQTLWGILKAYDKRSLIGFAYSPSNGGVPARLLSAVSAWHQAPKFTAAERRRHDKKIADASKTLEVLLAQVSPSHQLDDQYARFDFDDEHARNVFRSLGASARGQEIEKRGWPRMGYALGTHLQVAGVDPLWAVRNIQALATLGAARRDDVLPRKVRASGAKRTFYIVALYRAILGACMENLDQLGISYQLMADIAGLMADTDCSSDDVRKALESLGLPED